jgi:hypothetical protein
MADPIDPKDTSGCTDTMNASCIPWAGPAIQCLNICKGDSLEDVVVKEGNLLCQMVTDLNTLDNPPTPPVIDFSSLNLGCLWTPTVTVWSCPSPLTFLPDTSAPNGAGFCQGCCPPFLSIVAPTMSIVPNPVPRPTTLLGILQLILNKVPCCDPCR